MARNYKKAFKNYENALEGASKYKSDVGNAARKNTNQIKAKTRQIRAAPTSTNLLGVTCAKKRKVWTELKQRLGVELTWKSRKLLLYAKNAWTVSRCFVKMRQLIRLGKKGRCSDGFQDPATAQCSSSRWIQFSASKLSCRGAVCKHKQSWIRSGIGQKEYPTFLLKQNVIISRLIYFTFSRSIIRFRLKDDIHCYVTRNSSFINNLRINSTKCGLNGVHWRAIALYNKLPNKFEQMDPSTLKRHFHPSLGLTPKGGTRDIENPISQIRNSPQPSSNQEGNQAQDEIVPRLE